MLTNPHRSRSASSFIIVLVLACACARGSSPERGPRVAIRQPTPAPENMSFFYGPNEALRDALASPLEYIGTGKWPGIRRMYACAFRNARVVVVDVYCGRSDRQALRFDIYSPKRGRARIYAESRGSVSTQRPADYFTFMAESEPAPQARANLPALTLGMSLQELQRYEERRYEAFLPVCFAGRELSKARQGCLGDLATRAAEWNAQSRAFLTRPGEDWAQLVREMRALASRYGREPD